MIEKTKNNNSNNTVRGQKSISVKQLPQFVQIMIFQ